MDSDDYRYPTRPRHETLHHSNRPEEENPSKFVEVVSFCPNRSKSNKIVKLITPITCEPGCRHR